VGFNDTELYLNSSCKNQRFACSPRSGVWQISWLVAADQRLACSTATAVLIGMLLVDAMLHHVVALGEFLRLVRNVTSSRRGA
jgi:hypothetical protein